MKTSKCTLNRPHKWDRNANRGHKTCGEYGPNGLWVCTRQKGHKGKHIACGLETHNLLIW